MDLQSLLRVDPDHYNILFGFDEMLSAAWLYGVRIKSDLLTTTTTIQRHCSAESGDTLKHRNFKT